MVVIFNEQNYNLLTLSLLTEEVFQVNGQIDQWQIFYLSIFICVLVATIRESSDKQLVLRIVKALAFIHQPDLATLKASDVSAGDWLYQHT